MPISADLTYYLATFDRLDEAAAFIAALSRFVHSPRGAAFADARARVEVSAVAGRPEQRVDVYLTKHALAATSEAFGSFAATELGPTSSLPSKRITLIDGSRPTAYGKDELIHQLEHLVP